MKRIEDKSVYFVAPLVGKKKYGEIYKRISSILKKNNYKVYDDINNISHQEAQDFTENQMKKYFTRVEKLIRNSDIFVAEISEKSTSIGFEIGIAYILNKPILLLRSKEKSTKLGAPFRANKTKIIVRSYDETDIEQNINSFLKKSEKGILIDEKVIKFTAQNKKYIEHVQQKNNLSSFSLTLRKLIDQISEEDTSF